MQVRRWLGIAVALLIAVLAAASLRWEASSGVSAAAAPGERRPNVIIYLVDTLRPDHLGVYGYDRDTSPMLDRWAQGSVVFEQAYAPTSWTKPSMVTLFSGLDPVRHGVEDRFDVIPADVGLLAEHLKSLGYSTFGAVTNPYVLPKWGFGRGFDDYDDLGAAGHRTRADSVSDHVEERIEALARSQPFLLYLHVIDPHWPYEPPPPFDTRFPRLPIVPARDSVGAYDGEVAFVDSQFGRITELLGSHGLDADTMTVFVADHGEELWDHGRLGHGSTLFEEVVRVPLVIRFPKGLHAGARVGARATLSDLFPTILSVIGDSPPTGLDGHDLTQLLQETEPDWAKRDVLLSLRTSGQNSHVVRGVLNGPHKYLRRTRPDAEESLYDLAQDPAEYEDLTNDRADIHRRLAASLDAHLARRSSGIHLRILNHAAGDAVGAEVQLQTTGRFTGVSGVRLEPGDRLEVSEQGQRLHLNLRLVNRHQQLSLHAGFGRGETKVPFAFEATDSSWRIRDVGELLADAGSAAGDSPPKAYLGVVRAPAQRTEKLPKELLERLRSLGYLGGSEDVE